MENEEFQQSSKDILQKYNGEKARNFKNSRDKKNQETLNQLLDSQENIYHKVFEIFSPSSPSTNVGDFEDFFLSDAENANPDVRLNPQLSSTYDLRSRTVTKQEGKKKGTQSEISSVQNSKRRKHKLQRQNSTANDSDPDDGERETCSQKSVSMLQECYKNFENGFPELLETCTDSILELSASKDDDVKNVWDDTGSPQESEMISTVENSTQTELLVLFNVEREKEITKHSKFVGCIVRLKAMLSSKDKKVDISFHDVLRVIGNDSCEEEFSTMEASKRDATLPKETIGYILRSSDSENILRETVQTLILHLEDILKEDFIEAARCWRSSVYEMAVDILIEAVDCDHGIRKIVESFLLRLLESFSNDKERTKNLVLESKGVLIMTFCKSTYLSFTSIQYIIEYMKLLNTKPITFAKKQFRWNFVKNLCLLIRILEFCLESVKSKSQVNEIDKVLSKEQEVKNYNVLEIWKKHWRVNETPKKAKAEFQWKVTISNWLDALDEGLVNCVNHFPITAMAVERCKRLVMEILKICYPEERETENTED